MIILDGIVFSLQKFGGISTYYKHLTNALLNSQFKTEVLLYKQVNGLNSDSIPIKDKRFFERYRPIEINYDSDEILLHSSYFRFSQNKKVKNVITIYDFIYEKFEKNIIKKYVHIYQKKFAIRNASAIICISESTRKDFFQYYPNYNRQNVFVTHLAHSNKSIEHDKDFIFENKFVNSYVLFVGMRSLHKNFTSCVKALKDININFKIIGGGSLNKSELILLDSNIPGRYEHLLNVDNTQLNNYYVNAICLLYPSIYEGFGLPILEAMANGCAVITTNLSSIPEVSGDAAILLNDHSPCFINESIKAVLDPVYNRNLVNKGFRNIEKFSWEKTINQTIEIYKAVLSK
jgi:mannosyltransferase